MSIMYQPTDVVLAKVKGFPAWPAMIIPTEIIPSNVLKGRREIEEDTDDESKYIEYSSSLKFRKFDKTKNQYCVKFFWDDSYIWLKPNDMKPLGVQDCNSWLKSGKKKNKKLVQAFEMASKGSQSIDVWEFVEYGSAGRPDEEYVEEEEAPGEEEEDEEEEEEIARSDVSESYEEEKEQRPTRTSQRQKQKQSKENTRATRSRSKTAKSAEPQEIPLEEEPKPKKRKNTKHTEEQKFNFEDDENLFLVGLGPQDLSVQENVSPLVNKLSNKRNLERHTEIKLDIIDRLLSVNKLFLEVLVPETKPTGNDYQLILDELELALATKGSHDEFLTVFHMNSELLINFRALFNLKADELKKLGLWNPFQSAFSSIYEHEFEPDQEQWKLNTEILPPENDGVEA
ncbi:hypothetical protein ZYGM_000324 [Zygosaccharomyces mellis]|uniref:PWWP domain-containing protein n=1 Tax=Zygosaccharomyces mellis TaxID=42258 RepID=A0A4C2EBY7_9SACH|nr:hypothetical protein ZYGM_000324 [Zygosaccharomyces mellis]